ncbi:metallophosphoesterase [Deltaproteobacteria bacterium TL4]
MEKRTLIVGDVHGCLRELKDLLEKLKYRKDQDSLIFIGDLINKGPCSLEVIKTVRDLKAQVILGNHEWGFLKYLKDGSYAKDGFPKVEAALGDELPYWKAWFEQFPRYLETSDYLVVHAGFVPGIHPTCTSSRILTTIRTWDGAGNDLNNPVKDPAWYELYHEKKLVIFGHWAKQGLILRPNAIGLDTGCVYGGELSALVLPERTIVQVPAYQIYDMPTSEFIL